MTFTALPRRLDLLVPVHKALRHQMFQAVLTLGALDVSDDDAVQAVVDRTERLLDLLRDRDAATRHSLQALRDAPAGDRDAPAAAAYDALNRRVAEHLAALLAAEALHRSAANRGSDAQLAAARQRRLATLDDSELREALGWMAQALSPQELAVLLADLRSGAAPARYALALELLDTQPPAARRAPPAWGHGLPGLALAA